MTPDQFRASLSEPVPPTGLSPALLGLWHAGRGEWEEAHRTVQDDDGPDAAWVHAHLHKQEGDASNARYWYARATRNTFAMALSDEWNTISKELLAQEINK